MLAHVGAGGAAILFEKERHSRHGLAMAAKKFVTRHLRIPLAPRFYRAAHYPRLARFRRRLMNQTRRFRPTILTTPDGHLRVLVVRVDAVDTP